MLITELIVGLVVRIQIYQLISFVILNFEIMFLIDEIISFWIGVYG